MFASRANQNLIHEVAENIQLCGNGTKPWKVRYHVIRVVYREIYHNGNEHWNLVFNSTTIKRTTTTTRLLSDDVTPVFPPHEIDGQALWNQYKDQSTMVSKYT